jgi:hypothetical protein
MAGTTKPPPEMVTLPTPRVGHRVIPRASCPCRVILEWNRDPDGGVSKRGRLERCTECALERDEFVGENDWAIRRLLAETHQSVHRALYVTRQPCGCVYTLLRYIDPATRQSKNRCINELCDRCTIAQAEARGTW